MITTKVTAAISHSRSERFTLIAAAPVRRPKAATRRADIALSLAGGVLEAGLATAAKRDASLG
jgi:hypothetical protein